MDIVKKSIENSLCFGLFDDEKQVGFGRAITDYATFAYMADVFVVDNYRGKGLGKWLVSCILDHPDLQGLRRWMLATSRKEKKEAPEASEAPKKEPPKIVDETPLEPLPGSDAELYPFARKHYIQGRRYLAHSLPGMELMSMAWKR